ncbi:MAG: pyridoxal-phosphate dependent enzyme [Propionibacteriales bacterium]|nr:pyridoxal-phosphate dependent enzyme [Propionibacteriales bacterium]
MNEPTFDDVVRAAEFLRDRLPPTPMWNYPALDSAAGATVLVKHENVQPVGAFKVRGGLVFFAGLAEADRRRGVVTYSTGNHAQSMAYAAARSGARCVIAMPEGTNAVKVRAARALGAEVELYGASLAESHKRAEELAADQDLLPVSPGDEPALIAGVGTLYRELFAAADQLDAVVVPAGSGTGAAAACLVAEGMAEHCEIIAVQSSSSPAGHDSWHAGELLERPNLTTVDGLATGRAFGLPQRILRRRLDDFRLVSDEQIATARRLLATHAHTLAEGSGAAALAAVLNDDRFAGKRVAVICSGGNASPEELAELAAADMPG